MILKLFETGQLNDGKFQHLRSDGDRQRETFTHEKARASSTAESPQDTSEVLECMFCEVLGQEGPSHTRSCLDENQARTRSSI